MSKNSLPVQEETKRLVEDQLRTFGEGLPALRKLLRHLNYYPANEPHPVADWNDDLADRPILVATSNEDPAVSFVVIYIRLKDKALKLTAQRELLKYMSVDHALFVFSNQDEDTWHFVNVKLTRDRKSDDEKQGQKRRILRRIVVAPPYSHLHTAAERLAMLDLERITERGLFGLSEVAVQVLHDEAFDVETVTKKFFSEYKRIFDAAEKAIDGIESTDEKRLFAQKLFNRLMFIIFLEKKGWMTFNGGQDYLMQQWRDYSKATNQSAKRNFYNDRLKPLFFMALNNKDARDIMSKGRNLQELIGDVPYLNGGLFERSDHDEEDSSVVVPDHIMQQAIEGLFYAFNFTVVESTPLDVEVAVDPEMLGKIFEELVTGRHESGSYYTPKPIVSFMGREALKGYLETACPDETPEAIAKFVDEHKPTDLKDPEKILAALKKVTICDPACGSGAYLLGMLHELVDLRLALFQRKDIDAITAYERKLEIIQTNIYGVDSEEFAVNIARLRLWLSLIVDFEGGEPLPLPNLDFKIEIGDSLTGADPSGGLQLDLFRKGQIDRFLDCKQRYLKSHDQEKLELAEQIKTIRAEILEWARQDTHYQGGFDWVIEFAEVFLNGGFDIVVANPPYVRQELIRPLKPALESTYGKLYSGTADLYVFFYYRGFQLLKPNGMFTYISSNKWLRADYGKKLRKQIATTYETISITDFGDLPVFQDAIAYPQIFIARKAKPAKEGSFVYAPVSHLNEPYPDVRAVHHRIGNHLPTTLLDGEKWTLVSEAGMNVLQKITANTTPLGEYVEGGMYRGIVTGLNEAFIIDEVKRAELIAADPRSAEVIKPYLRGRDIKRWQTNLEGLYIVALQNSSGVDSENSWGDANTETAAESIFKATYPAIYSYMKMYEDKLRSRTDQGKWWWELRACAYYSDFKESNITWGNLALEPQFAMTSSGTYVNAPANIIVAEISALYYLIGVLNSKITQYFIGFTGATRSGGFIEYKPMYVSQVPIPNIKTPLQQKIAKLAQRCLELATENPEQLSIVEAELNQLVYQAYGLNADDIAIIEENL